MRNKVILLIMVVMQATMQMAFAGPLTPIEIERVKVFKQLVQEVDRKPLHQTIEDLEKTAHPKTSLWVKEAMAQTYMDIVREQNVQGQGKKEWLYSMINLNMAYLQFVGTKQRMKTGNSLNVLICHKLKEHLPPDIDSQPGFHQSIN